MSKDVSSVPSMAGVLFSEKAEMPKVYIINLSNGIGHVNPRHWFHIMCMSITIICYAFLSDESLFT